MKIWFACVLLVAVVATVFAEASPDADPHRPYHGGYGHRPRPIANLVRRVVANRVADSIIHNQHRGYGYGHGHGFGGYGHRYKRSGDLSLPYPPGEDVK